MQQFEKTALENVSKNAITSSAKLSYEEKN